MSNRIKAGHKVAFNNLADATWFEVIERDGFILTVREENTDFAPQKIDVSAVKQVRA